jgi:aryl-alcohol dehydrogenase-like predicted oxidoreductase
MPLRPLGSSDLKVTPVIFGAWAVAGWMWGGNDEADSIEAIRASVRAGVNTIDTAAIYGQGYGEEVVAKAIKGMRDKVIIATKCGRRWDSPTGSNPWTTTDRLGSEITIRTISKPASIFHECEQSLKRLRTDVIDLYQIHWPDTETPAEESMGAMMKLKKQGKIRAIGVSNYNLEQLESAAKHAPIASLQPPYSIIQRQIENGLLPFCRTNNIAVIVYSPLERGLLTGKVTPDRKFPEGDHRATHKSFTPENRQRILDTLEKLRPLADKHKASFAQLLIAWTISQPGITAALVGARNAEQSVHNAQAMNIKLSPAELAQIRFTFDETAKEMAS